MKNVLIITMIVSLLIGIITHYVHKFKIAENKKEKDSLVRNQLNNNVEYIKKISRIAIIIAVVSYIVFGFKYL